MTINQDIKKINWDDFETAYGKADKIPDYLINLFSGDKELAMKATHDLWCSLCHQHAYISSAALPSYNFLKQGLSTLDNELKIEILDILRGFSVCTTKSYYKETKSEISSWEKELRQQLVADIEFFLKLSTQNDELISGFASDIVADLTTDI